MKSPKVSIITPSFNKPSYVIDAIDSVLTQTYRNFEYLIIENSTDIETKRRIKSFNDKRIHYVDYKFTTDQRKSFYAPAYICNIFYPKANGEFIMFLADDDILLPDCLQVMVNYFLSNPQADVCFHDQLVLYTFNNSASFEPLVRGYNKIMSKGKINPKNLLDGGQIMFRKKLLHKIPQPFFPVEWSGGIANICDKLFMEKLWKISPFYPTNQILSIHRVVPNSTHLNGKFLKYIFYQYITTFLPDFIQQLISAVKHKRRALTPVEKVWFNQKKLLWLSRYSIQ